MDRTEFWQDQVIGTEIYNKIKAISDTLHSQFCDSKLMSDITKANMPGIKSHEVQDLLLGPASKLGFSSEKKGLFNNYEVSGLRPDYYLKVDDSGIIFEVGRGKTTRNNMDMLDFWKCHLCNEAEYLFLAVPKLLQQNDKEVAANRGSKEYNSVCRRLATFFNSSNYTNVKGVVIFGY